MTSTYYAAWWNLENLFDYENSLRRSSKLRRVLGDSIRGWTPQLRDRKIAQLASVIARMNDGAGPDLLGVCEVENAWVLTRLATAVSKALGGRDYAVAHADTIDERGIDVAFLYDPGLFTAPAGQLFQHVVMRRTATREIVQVNFTTGHPAPAASWSRLVIGRSPGRRWPTSINGCWRCTASTHRC